MQDPSVLGEMGVLISMGNGLYTWSESTSPPSAERETGPRSSVVWVGHFSTFQVASDSEED